MLIVDGPTDAGGFLLEFSIVAHRWARHVAACAAADETRARLECAVAAALVVGDGSGSIGGSSNKSSFSEEEPFPTPAAAAAPPGSSSSTSSSSTSSDPSSAKLELHDLAPHYWPVPYRRVFSGTTVSCALEDLWPHLMRFAVLTLKLPPAFFPPTTPATNHAATTATTVTSTSPFYSSLASVPAAPPQPPPAAPLQHSQAQHSQPAPPNVYALLPLLTPMQRLPITATPPADLPKAPPHDNEMRQAAVQVVARATGACLFLVGGGGLPPAAALATVAHAREGLRALWCVERALLTSAGRGGGGGMPGGARGDGWRWSVASWMTLKGWPLGR